MVIFFSVTKECKESKELYPGVRRSHRTGFLIAIAAALISSWIIAVYPVYGQVGNVIQQLPLEQKMVRGGPYTNDQWGVSVNLPSGWVGLAKQSSWALDVEMAPTNTILTDIALYAVEGQAALVNASFQMISFDVIDKTKEPSVYSSANRIDSLALSLGCTTVNDNYTMINGVNFHSVTKECPISTPYLELKEYTFETGTKEYDFEYLADPASNFNQYLGIFDNAAQSIQITGYLRQPTPSPAPMPLPIPSPTPTPTPTPTPAQSAPLTSTMTVQDTPYSISYSVTNGNVLEIKANPQSKSLIATIQTVGDGILTITMPRVLIDAKNSYGADNQFIVLNDGQQNGQASESTASNNDRTLAIPFKYGTQQIEIVGTQVVPEFGYASLVFLASILGLIGISYIRKANRSRI